MYVNPLIEAYQKNGIRSYSKISIWKDSVVNKQLVKLNSEGLVTDDSDFYSERHYTYDSLNRVVEYKYREDIRVDCKYTYQLDSKNHQVLQHLVGNSAIRYFKYDVAFKKLLHVYLVSKESQDLMENTFYRYTGDKIAMVVHGATLEMPKVSVITRYVYDRNQQLKAIINGGEIQYISSKTGLIDSASNGVDRIKYVYGNER